MHKIQRVEARDPEMQLWPVTTASLVLAGLTAGAITATSDFQSSELLANGWFRLGVLSLTVAAILAAAIALRGRVLARLQIALLFALLAHLVLMIVMYENSIMITFFRPEPPGEQPVPRERVVLPEYGIPVHNRRPSEQPFEKPVETPQEQQHQPTEAQELKMNVEPAQRERPTPEDQPTPVPQPQPIDLKREEVSVARQAERLAGQTISRQEMSVQTPTDQAVPTPEMPQSQQQQAESRPIEADTQLAERRPTPVDRLRQPSETPDASTPEISTQAEMRRQETPSERPIERLEQSQIARQSQDRPVLRQPDAAAPVNLPAAPSPRPVAENRQSETFDLAETGALGRPSTDVARRPTASPAASGSTSEAATAALGQPAAAALRRATSDRGEPVASLPGETGQLTRADRAGAGTAGAASGASVDLSVTAPVAQESSGGSPADVAAELAQSTGLGRRQSANPSGSVSANVGQAMPGESGEPSPGVDLAAGGQQRSTPGARQLEGSSLADTGSVDRLPTRTTGDFRMPSGESVSLDQVADMPAGGSPSQQGTGNTPGLPGETGTAGLRRRESGRQVVANAPEGPGGLIANAPGEMGLPDRRANRDAESVHLDIARFILDRSLGRSSSSLKMDTDPVPTYMLREPEMRQEIAEQFGGDKETEEAVELGLAYLARIQQPDGSWNLHGAEGERLSVEDQRKESPTAATGLALLAFLGAGYDHQEGKYAATVERGLNWLTAQQRPDGNLYSRGSDERVQLYSHGIAAIPLCEAYAMTRDASLREPAERALRFIIRSQDQKRGGWRYRPWDPTESGPERQFQSDTSVTGWQMMALKSGQLAGLNVPQSSFDGVERWLEFAAHTLPSGRKDYSRYAYLPAEGRLRAEQVPTPTMTAESLLMRLYLGWNRDRDEMQQGADYLITYPPPRTMFEQSSRPNAYYWYYATQVMFQMGGEHWEVWNGRLKSLLVDSQRKDGPLAGSWDPNRDAWGPQGGRVFVTTMHLLMLEVYYRHLPLFRLEDQPDGKGDGGGNPFAIPR
jgi:hypothetical protein